MWVRWGWLSQTRPIPRSPDGDKKNSPIVSSITDIGVPCAIVDGKWNIYMNNILNIGFCGYSLWLFLMDIFFLV